MRKTLLIITLGLLFSCATETSQETVNINPAPDTLTNRPNDFRTFDTLVSFAGSWLSQDYFNSIKKFKSPREAQDDSEFIIIPKRTLQGTIMIYNFHEGGAFLKVVKNNENYEL